MKGGVLQPTDTDAKSGRPVIEVLHAKHPDMQVPMDTHFYKYKDKTCLNLVPLFSFEGDVETAATHLL